VAPKDITIQQICLASVPYIIFDVLIMAMIIGWPPLALWLPSFVQ